jgi:ligand-binding SRPBCC domain-containing protein
MKTAIFLSCAVLISFFSFGASFAETVEIAPVEIISLDHQHTYDSYEDKGTIRDSVTFPSGPGTFDGPGFTVSIGGTDTIVARFEAPEGKKFVLTPHPDASSNLFHFDAYWTTGVGDIGSNFPTGTVTFENLSGAAPSENWNQGMVSDNGEAIRISAQFDLTAPCEFTAVKFEFTLSQSLSDISRTYGTVHSYSAPSFGVYSTTGNNGGPIDDQIVMAIVSPPKTVEIAPVEIISLHHQHTYDSYEDKGTVRDSVTFPSGPGTFDGPGFTVSIAGTDTVVARFEAPEGNKFVLTPHPDVATNLFHFDAYWTTGVSDTGSNFPTGTVTFENLSGTAPSENWNQGMVSDNGETIRVSAQFNLTAPCEFTAVEIEFTLSQSLADTSRTYGTVNSYSAPSFGVYSTTGSNGGPLDDQTLMSITSLYETVEIPPVEIISLYHNHYYDSMLDYGSVSDTVTFPSGPGTFDGPGFTASIGGSDTIVARFEPPEDKKFVITPQPDAVSNTFYFNAAWQTGIGDMGSYYPAGTVTFENLSGSEPNQTFGSYMLTNDGQTVLIEGYFNLTSDCEFTAVEIEFTLSQPTADTSRTYGTVYSYSSPSFGTFSSNNMGDGPLDDQTVMAIVDIGPTDCDEVKQEGYQLPQDLNGDCYVDLADFALFASAYLSCNDPTDSDCTPNWP